MRAQQLQKRRGQATPCALAIGGFRQLLAYGFLLQQSSYMSAVNQLVLFPSLFYLRMGTQKPLKS